MACGTPATSTPVGMMRELLRDGENGALASFDAPSLAAALMRVLDDEPARLAMGRAARRDAERFEYHRAIETYAIGLQSIARGEVPQ
jgi:glycosyltransferase involved in cell wall biosynthesis